MTSLPERTAKEDLQDSSAHVKPRKQDAADIPSDKSIMGERLRDAVAWNADIKVRTHHPCVKNANQVEFRGEIYRNYECRSHAMTACNQKLRRACRPRKIYYAAMGRSLNESCECE